MTKTIPVELKQFIEKYFNLNICGENIVCPYFMNTKTGFLKNPIYSGKGTAIEIENEANKNFEGLKLSQQEIIDEMVKLGLGVDCSGFIYRVYDYWLNNILQKGELKEFLPTQKTFNIRKIFSRKLKPQSSVSANMFTSEPLAKSIELAEVRPGDLIRTRGGAHVVFIYEVEYEKGVPKIIRFVHSTNKYHRTGIRYEEIYLNDKLDLATSEWRNNDQKEDANQTYQGYRVLMNNNGVFRPQLPLDLN